MNKKQNINKVKILCIVVGIIIILFLTNVIVQRSTGKSLIELIFEPKENSKNIEPSCGTPVPSNSNGIDIYEVDKKPIIYLYPTEETQISVKLKNENNITSSYPKYKENWHVIAKPNGDLKDIKTEKELYSLYYECNNIKSYEIENEGFVVRGENSAEFLEEKLSILGLNEREAEEFIIYWLPKLESNKYNYIRFATTEEIEQNMPLEITPKPNTTIRIMMTFKGLDNPIQVEEQRLQQVERNGYVAVEWGGSEIK